jgi:hypothetical protein
MISAYEHGQNAAKNAKHIQACPFDTGTVEWREWRAGFHASSQTLPNNFNRLAIEMERRPRFSRGANAERTPSWPISMLRRYAP